MTYRSSAHKLWGSKFSQLLSPLTATYFLRGWTILSTFMSIFQACLIWRRSSPPRLASTVTPLQLNQRIKWSSYLIPSDTWQLITFNWENWSLSPDTAISTPSTICNSSINLSFLGIQSAKFQSSSSIWNQMMYPEREWRKLVLSMLAHNSSTFPKANQMQAAVSFSVRCLGTLGGLQPSQRSTLNY